MLEPYAVKVASTVLRRGRGVTALSYSTFISVIRGIRVRFKLISKTFKINNAFNNGAE
jgi:hypothetical protein